MKVGVDVSFLIIAQALFLMPLLEMLRMSMKCFAPMSSLRILLQRQSSASEIVLGISTEIESV